MSVSASRADGEGLRADWGFSWGLTMGIVTGVRILWVLVFFRFLRLGSRLG